MPPDILSTQNILLGILILLMGVLVVRSFINKEPPLCLRPRRKLHPFNAKARFISAASADSDIPRLKSGDEGPTLATATMDCIIAELNRRDLAYCLFYHYRAEDSYGFYYSNALEGRVLVESFLDSFNPNQPMMDFEDDE